jgi:hypothetical protein
VTIGTSNKILASDYNAIQSTIANILGSGSGNSGYGQSVSSSQVTTGTKIQVTSNSLGYLAADMAKIAAHQGTSITIPTNISAGNKILAADFTSLNSIASTLNTNRFNITSGQYSTVTYSTGTRTTTWGGGSTSISHTVSLTFASNNAARYYFNAGGNVQFSATLTGYSGQQSTDWYDLFVNMGTISFNYGSTSSSASTGTGSSIGWYQLSTTAQQIYTHSGGGSGNTKYNVNSYTITAASNAAIASATAVTFVITFLDAHTDTYYDYVNGTLTSTVAGRYASGSNVSVTAPTASPTTVSM